MRKAWQKPPVRAPSHVLVINGKRGANSKTSPVPGEISFTQIPRALAIWVSEELRAPANFLGDEIRSTINLCCAVVSGFHEAEVAPQLILLRYVRSARMNMIPTVAFDTKHAANIRCVPPVIRPPRMLRQATYLEFLPGFWRGNDERCHLDRNVTAKIHGEVANNVCEAPPVSKRWMFNVVPIECDTVVTSQSNTIAWRLRPSENRIDHTAQGNNAESNTVDCLQVCA